MKKVYTIIFLFILGTSAANANTRRYRLMFNDDPATTITIGWEQISGTDQKVYFGTTDFGMNYLQYADSMVPHRSTTYMGMENQFVKLTNLSPNTAYYFVIRDSEGVSERYWFRTCPNDNTQPLSFISGGDSRSGYTQRIAANKVVAKIRPHAVLFGGDLTNTPGDVSTQDWLDHWQFTTTTDGQMIPVFHSFGNHEALGTGGANYIRDLFDVSEGTYYKVTFGGDLFSVYTMNGEVMPGHTIVDATIRQDQINWLNATLPNDTAIWKSAQYHRPIMPHNSTKQDGLEEYEDWAELFYDNEVRLVMESDAHVVKVSEQVRPTPAPVNLPTSANWFATDNIPVNKGLNFIGEGSWGTLRTDDKTHTSTKVSGSFYQFNWIIVTPCKIIVRSIDTQSPDLMKEHIAEDYFSITNDLDALIWKPTESENGRFFIDRDCSTPFASYSTENDVVCLGETVVFENQSENNPTSYKWYFGDGDSSSLENPSHLYSSPGQYNVTLEVSNANGQDTRTVQNLISVNATPILDVTENASVCDGESVTISASGADEYVWDNGLDNSASHDVAPTANTTYNVVGTTNGCSASATIDVVLSTNPILTITQDQTICIGETATITVAGATTYEWDNGLTTDETQIVSPTQNTTYTVTGTSNGCSSSTSVDVFTKANPTLTISEDQTICAGDSASFTVDGADEYVWDNGLSTEAMQTVSPAENTIYSATGIIDGCSSIITVEVIVEPTPELTVGTDQIVCIGNTITLTAEGATTYAWNNGITTASQVVSPTENTTYTVTGTIDNCSSEASIAVTVLDSSRSGFGSI